MGTGRYLGMPSMVGRNKKAVFGYLKDRMWKRIQGWSGKHLSKAGREVLVKSIAQAIPTYCMSTILLPESLGEELERMINSFWWGANKASGRGINWLRWEKLAMRKEHGGMGFRHFYGFNLAMLGKQGWHLLTNQDTILSRVFKAKYYPKSGFLEAKLGHNPSYVWRSIHASQVVVRRGLRWRIGNGNSINVWTHPWLRNDAYTHVTTDMIAGREEMRVAELMNETTGTWNIALIRQMFNHRDAAEIRRLPINLLNREDEPIWRYSKNGNYTVRSAYYQLMEHIVDNNDLKEPGNWKKLWSLNVPNKVRIFIWRLLRGCLPVRGRLVQRGVPCDNKCPSCASYEENEWHCFFGCGAVQEIWEQSLIWNQVRPYIDNAIGIVQMLFQMLEELEATTCCNIAMLLWAVWWKRNQVCWQGQTPTSYAVIRRAHEQYEDWTKVRKMQQNISNNSSTVEDIKWTKPPLNMLKCNVDAACYNESNRYGIAACVRDSQGRFVKAYTRWFEGKPDISEQKLWECWKL